MFGRKRRAARDAEIEAHFAERQQERQDLIAYWKGRIVDGRLDVTGEEFGTLITTNVGGRIWWPLFRYLGGNGGLKVYIDGKLYEKPKTHEERRTEAAERAAAALECLRLPDHGFKFLAALCADGVGMEWNGGKTLVFTFPTKEAAGDASSTFMYGVQGYERPS